MSDEPKNYRTMLDAINDLVARGYDYNYQYKDGLLYCDRNDNRYCPEDLLITEFHRFEGMSDPADNTVVYAIESKDGTKGVLVDAYGMYADEAKGLFLEQIPLRPSN